MASTLSKCGRTSLEGPYLVSVACDAAFLAPGIIFPIEGDNAAIARDWLGIEVDLSSTIPQWNRIEIRNQV